MAFKYAELLSLQRPEPSTPGTPEVTTGIPTVAIGTPPEVVFKTERNVVVRQEKQAQDGHTRGEVATYNALWTMTETMGLTGETRRLLTGYKEIGKLSRQSRNTIQANLRSLEQKLALEKGPTSASGTVYIVYSYREILRRRQMAGLTHFIRMNGGAYYVDPVTGEPIKSTFGIPTLGIPKPTSGIPSLGIPGIPTLGIPGIPEVGTPSLLEKFLERDKEWARERLRDKTTTDEDRRIAMVVLGKTPP